VVFAVRQWRKFPATVPAGGDMVVDGATTATSDCQSEVPATAGVLVAIRCVIPRVTEPRIGIKRNARKRCESAHLCRRMICLV
jgi:hypothetical protein